MRSQAMRAGAMDFLAKPFDDEVLLESVRAAIEN
jgi:FixJ family two-component response regulator